MKQTRERERQQQLKKRKEKKASKVGEVNYVVQYLNWRIKRGNVHSERERKKTERMIWTDLFYKNSFMQGTN